MSDAGQSDLSLSTVAAGQRLSQQRFVAHANVLKRRVLLQQKNNNGIRI